MHAVDNKLDLNDLANEILELESETFEISDYSDTGAVLLAACTSSTSTCSSTTSTTSCCG